jgi:hypothetical protein
MKSNQMVEPVIDVAAGTVTFNVRGHDSLTLHMDKVHADNVRRAAFVGFAQVRIVDAAAVGLSDQDGKIIPAGIRDKMKFDRMAALIAHYESGTPEWSRVRGDGAAETGVLFRALCIVYPNRTPKEVREWLDGHTKAEQAQMRLSQSVRAAIATFTDGSAGDALIAEWE